MTVALITDTVEEQRKTISLPSFFFSPPLNQIPLLLEQDTRHSPGELLRPSRPPRHAAPCAEQPSAPHPLARPLPHASRARRSPRSPRIHSAGRRRGSGRAAGTPGPAALRPSLCTARQPQGRGTGRHQPGLEPLSVPAATPGEARGGNPAENNFGAGAAPPSPARGRAAARPERGATRR